MAANIAEADKLSLEQLGDLIDAECGDQGVLYVNLNPDLVLRRLQLAVQQKRDELRLLPAPLAERKPEAFDASTGASLVVLAASKPHRCGVSPRFSHYPSCWSLSLSLSPCPMC